MINLKQVLVLVADASEAKIFIAHGPHKITQISHLQNEISSNNMTKQEKFSFARELARTIEKTLENDNLTDLCIIAAPHFLGELHKNLIFKNANVTSINKDMLSANDDKILHDIRAAGVTFLPA